MQWRGGQCDRQDALSPHTVLGVAQPPEASRAASALRIGVPVRSSSDGHYSSGIQGLWLNQRKLLLWGVRACMFHAVSGSARREPAHRVCF